MSTKDRLLKVADTDILRRLAQVSNSWDGSLEEYDVQDEIKEILAENEDEE